MAERREFEEVPFQLARLRELARTASPSLRDDDVERLISAFIAVTPPRIGEIARSIGYVTINARSGGSASSRKPGNIVLNWRKLFDLLPDAGLAGIGASTAPPNVYPWALVLAALYIWNKLWRGAEEKLSEVEASILMALWNHRAEGRISEVDARTIVNTMRVQTGLTALEVDQYANAMNRLAAIDCLTIEDGWIVLRETIAIRY